MLLASTLLPTLPDKLILRNLNAQGPFGGLFFYCRIFGIYVCNARRLLDPYERALHIHFPTMAARSTGIFVREGFNLDEEMLVPASGTVPANLYHAKTIRVIAINVSGTDLVATIGGQKLP